MSNIIYGIDISALLKARDTFERFRQNLITDQDKAGAVQAFEFCYELAWKTMKRLLDKKGVEVRSPRDCFREAALTGMISDPKIWFEFIEKRNNTVHTYDEAILEDIVDSFDEFSQALSALIINIENEK